MTYRSDNCVSNSYLIGSSEEWKLCLQESVDLAKSEFLAGHRLDGHHYEGDVAVGGLLLPPGTYKMKDS
jgi:hypothetical protein